MWKALSRKMKIERYAAGTIIVLAAMTGIYYHVEYSGWTLFVGLYMLF